MKRTCRIAVLTFICVAILELLVMATTIADIRQKVQARIQDDGSKLTLTALTGDVDRAILAAVAQYSQDRPREVVVTKAGDGGFDYALSAFGAAAIGSVASTQFVDGFSDLLDLVFPYTSTDQGFEGLDADDYELVRLPSGLTLRFLADKPATTETMLLRYTRPHDLDGSLSTLPASDEEAVADLGAAFCCEELAAVYAQAKDSSLAADTSDHRNKSDLYRSLATRYADRYDEKMGQAEGAAAAAATHVEIDRGFTDRAKTDYFFHGRRRL